MTKKRDRRKEKKEITAPEKVVMALSDSQHFSAREYRNQIYREAVTGLDVRKRKSRRGENEKKIKPIKYPRYKKIL